MRILITRPIEDARPLADALEERGIAVLIEPLLEIRHLEDAEIDLQGVQALLFTSANGVRAFAALSPRREIKVFTVGDGSADAARQAGFPHVDSAKGDVEALAALVVDRLKAGDGVLFHAAGTVTAGVLKTRLEGLGYQVRRAQLYEAKIATALSTEARANLQPGGIVAVLLFSPRTAVTFADLWRSAGSPPLDRIQALCLSAAVAREIGSLGWAGIEIADRPDLPSMLALVDAARSKGAEMAEPSQRPEDISAGGAADSAAETPAASMAANEARNARRQRAGGGSMLFYLVLMLIAAAAVVVTAPAWQPQVSALLGLQGPSTTPAAPDDDRVATLQGDVENLSQRVQASVDDETLRQAVEPLKAEIDGLKQEVTALKTEIETLRSNAGNGSTTLSQGPSVDLTPIEDRLGKLETALSEANARIDQAASGQGTTAGT